MRIAILCHAGCGGSGLVATRSAYELARRGHEVHVFSRRKPFAYRDHPRLILHVLKTGHESDQGALRTAWSDNEQQLLLRRLRSVAAALPLDLIHFHYAVPFAFLIDQFKRTALGSSTPVIGTLHGTDVSVSETYPQQRARLHDALSRVDALTTVSHDYARRALFAFGLLRRPRVIPNFIDLPRIAAHQMVEARGNDGPTIMVHMSNFRPVKDPLTTVRIFAGVRKTLDAELWLIGDGSEMTGVRRLVAQQCLERHVRFYGFQADVLPFLQKADVMVLSSREESFGLAALEAMACGVPVLAPDVGGLPEVIVDGHTGYLYPPDDIDRAIALAIDLVSSPARRQAMVAAGVAHAKHFDRKLIVTLYEQLYAEVTGRIDSVPLQKRRYKDVFIPSTI